MTTKFNEPSIWEIRASFKTNSELARAVHPLMTWCQYEKYQAHTWALRLIKADPSTGEDVAAALTNLDSMIEGAKATYRDNARERARCDAVLEAFNAWKATNPPWPLLSTGRPRREDVPPVNADEPRRDSTERRHITSRWSTPMPEQIEATKPKHTPGPWRVTRADGLPNAVVAPDEAMGSVGVAKIVVLNDHEANARLIAAAPDLVAALQELLNAYKGLAAIGEDRARRMNSAENMARAALAKAEVA